MANLVLAFGELMGGAIILDAAIKGDSVSNVVRGTASQQTLSGSTSSTGAGSSTVSPAIATAASVGAGGYVAPIPPKVANVGRTDMGVDISAPPGTPVRSIGPARVTAILKNWYQNQPLIMTQLLSGPERGKFVYYAEQLIPQVQVGQTVNAGDELGYVAPSGTGLEIGYGGSQAGQTLAQTTTGYTEGEQTTAGKEFRALLQRIGF